MRRRQARLQSLTDERFLARLSMYGSADANGLARLSWGPLHGGLLFFFAVIGGGSRRHRSASECVARKIGATERSSIALRTRFRRDNRRRRERKRRHSTRSEERISLTDEVRAGGKKIEIHVARRGKRSNLADHQEPRTGLHEYCMMQWSLRSGTWHRVARLSSAKAPAVAHSRIPFRAFVGRVEGQTEEAARPLTRSSSLRGKPNVRWSFIRPYVTGIPLWHHVQSVSTNCAGQRR